MQQISQTLFVDERPFYREVSARESPRRIRRGPKKDRKCVCAWTDRSTSFLKNVFTCTFSKTGVSSSRGHGESGVRGNNNTEQQHARRFDTAGFVASSRNAQFELRAARGSRPLRLAAAKRAAIVRHFRSVRFGSVLKPLARPTLHRGSSAFFRTEFLSPPILPLRHFPRDYFHNFFSRERKLQENTLEDIFEIVSLTFDCIKFESKRL